MRQARCGSRNRGIGQRSIGDRSSNTAASLGAAALTAIVAVALAPAAVATADLSDGEDFWCTTNPSQVVSAARALELVEAPPKGSGSGPAVVLPASPQVLNPGEWKQADLASYSRSCSAAFRALSGQPVATESDDEGWLKPAGIALLGAVLGGLGSYLSSRQMQGRQWRRELKAQASASLSDLLLAKDELVQNINPVGPAPAMAERVVRHGRALEAALLGLEVKIPSEVNSAIEDWPTAVTGDQTGIESEANAIKSYVRRLL